MSTDLADRDRRTMTKLQKERDPPSMQSGWFWKLFLAKVQAPQWTLFGETGAGIG
jgi:hypothetical protein